MRRDAVTIVLGTLLWVPGTTFATAGEGAPLASTPHFVFHSDFDTNLNDALIASGGARKLGRAEPFDPDAEDSCFAGLPPSQRAGWNLAVDYYAQIVSPAEWNDRQQYLLRMDLAGFDDQLDDDRAREYVDLVGHVRAAAAPAYEACRWATQDAANRRWIEDVASLLAAHGKSIAARLEKHYRKPWPETPVRVDVVETVNWSGANSTSPDGRGHVLVSTSYAGHQALEIVFHEASHGFMLRGDPLPRALAAAAAKLGVEEPADLWHVLLFHTTGEVVRGVLAAAGEPGYRPLLHEIYQRSDWVRYRDAIESVWPAYLNGDREPAAVMLDLLRATD